MGELKKVMGFKSILLIIICSIMGTGIYFLPAVSGLIGGPAALISWFIMSLVAIYISMVFAELCSMFPTSGGVYDYCKKAYGKTTSFIIGWLTLVAGNITIAMLIVGAIQYLLGASVKIVIISVSILFLIIFNTFAYRGMKSSVTMLITFAVITLVTLFALIIPGLIKFNIHNLTPFFQMPKYTIYLTLFFIAETFFGWESATLLAGEVKEGHKVVPKALIIGTIIISIICLLFVLSAFGSADIGIFGNSKAPLTELGRIHYGDIGVTIFTLLVYLSIIGSVADWAISAPRLVLSLAKDKLFLTQFADIHPKFNTPYKAIIFQTIVSIILVIAGAGNYHTLLELLVPLLLVMYSVVMITLVVLRVKRPDIKRYYRAPFGIIGPILVVLFFISLMIMWIIHTPSAWPTIRLGLSFIIFGYPIYFLLQMYHDPKMIVGVNDFFAYITLYTEKIFLPIKVREEILLLLGDIKNKSILEYGCSVGGLTLHLAEAVGPTGKVFATDLSERELVIVRRRIQREGHTHVEVMHDPLLHSRVHQHVPNVNGIVSVGMMGYVQQVEHVLRGLNRRLKHGDRIVVLDYDKFFYFIPNIPWLSSDDEIKKVFNTCGFNVGVVRKQGRFWQYIYIYGIKERDV